MGHPLGHISRTLVWILGLGILLLGCSTTRVAIQVKVPSEIDVARYKRLAVLPFIERVPPEKKKAAHETWGVELASTVRRSLNRPHQFEILSEKETEAMLAGVELEPSLLEDTDQLATLGLELNVDALILGTYRFTTVSEPRRVYYDRYSPSLQRYVTESVIYYQKSYRLAVEIVVADAETGEIVWRHPYQAKAWETHNVATFLISEAVQNDSVFQNLANQVAASFTRHLAPHFERAERLLVKG